MKALKLFSIYIVNLIWSEEYHKDSNNCFHWINLAFDNSNTYMMSLSMSLVNLSTCTLISMYVYNVGINRFFWTLNLLFWQQNDSWKVAIISIGTFVVKNILNGGLVWACCLTIIFSLAFYLSESKIIGLSDKWFRNESRNKTIVGKSRFLALALSSSKMYLMEASFELVVQR